MILLGHHLIIYVLILINYNNNLTLDFSLKVSPIELDRDIAKPMLNPVPLK